MKRLLPLLLLSACNQNMVQQPRYDDYERSPLTGDGTTMQAPPAGTVAQDAPLHVTEMQRPPLTPTLLARGKARFEIYCSMCHGYDGRGDGIVPARGFPHPPSYLEPRLVQAPAAHFYDVMTDGYGVMYSYADRVSPRDRWAIAAYIRALQAAGLADRRAQILPGTGRGTAAEGGGGGGPPRSDSLEANPLHQPAAGPHPRAGEELEAR